MSIFHSDKLIVLYYHSGAGGKFLANCLGLSSKCVLQHANLAQQQLDGELSPDQKFDLIMSRLDCSMSWNDLGLGDSQYFGKSLDQIVDQSQLGFVCKEVCNQNLFFVACFHDIEAVNITIKKWPNAKIIHFANDLKFLTKHRTSYLNQLSEYWQLVKGPEWPSTSPGSMKEVSQLPVFVQYELKNLFKNQIYNKVELTTEEFALLIEQDNPILEWNCDWYLDVESTVKSIEYLYKFLGLSDFNPDWIRLYWSKWIEKITSVDPIRLLVIESDQETLY